MSENYIEVNGSSGNYICLNGKRAELTEKQMIALGLKLKFDELADAAKRGEAEKYVSIGDNVPCNGANYKVIGIGHDEDEKGNRDTITFMKDYTLPNRPMNTSGDCDWANSELREWLNKSFLDTMPEEIKRNLRKVIKLTSDADGNIVKTLDRLFVPSETEMFGSAIYAAKEDGKRYPVFSDSESRCRGANEDGYDWYWLRSSMAGSAANFAYVTTTGIRTIPGRRIRTSACPSASVSNIL